VLSLEHEEEKHLGFQVYLIMQEETMITPASSNETFGLPINQQTAFSDKKGNVQERIKKQQLKMLKDYVPFLKQFLEPGEEILLCMRGCSPMTFLEQFTTGWMIYILKRCFLVVTNKRILHFPAKQNFSPRHSVAQIRFGDVEEISPVPFMGRFTVKYKNGRKELFQSVKESAKLKSLLPGLQLTGQQPTAIGIRHHLCPKCNAVLSPGVYFCSSCRLEFKSWKRARTLSLLYPGGGYFYTGHPFLGAGDALVETFLIFMVVMGLVNMLSNVPEKSVGTVQFIFFGFLLVVEKLYSVHHAKHYVKEYIPVESGFQPVKKV
jgi:hypothetical protein